MVDITVEKFIVPFQVIDVVNALEIHGDALNPVSYLTRNWFQVKTANLLEISELSNLHAIKPDLPSQAPGAQGR